MHTCEGSVMQLQVPTTGDNNTACGLNHNDIFTRSLNPTFPDPSRGRKAFVFAPGSPKPAPPGESFPWVSICG